eukprot:CAMPEP_0118932310 /NCGR_PEP_ID=MMETSP1169-20130426/9835_1 /TAXON_ID=36882 /ORGANISM="Pyramimonas obovata, Strain CCMP722" /LENGTH=34 /DNA_ID= /DNA_START= /DNA_END= /DNA_ORIENTATION=
MRDSPKYKYGEAQAQHAGRLRSFHIAQCALGQLM